MGEIVLISEQDLMGILWMKLLSVNLINLVHGLVVF